MTEFVQQDELPTHGSSRLLVIGGVLLLVLTLVTTGFTILNSRDETIDRYSRDTNTLGLALADQTNRVMSNVETVLEQIQQQIAGMKIETPAEFANKLGGEPFGHALIEWGKTPVQVDGLVLIDASGFLINSSTEMSATPVNLSDRDYFVHFLNDDDKSSFIGRPVPNRLTGERAFYVVRRIDNSAGEFLGLILARIELSSFERILASVVPPDGGSVALFRSDGTILARSPEGQAAIGSKISSASRWWRVVEHGGGTYRSAGQFDEAARIISVHPVKGFPLVVGVTVAEEAALSQWQRQSIIIGGAFLAILLCAAFLFYWSLRQYGQLAASRAKLAANNVELRDSRRRFEQQAADMAHAAEALRVSEYRLERQSKALEVTFKYMDQGIMMVDANHRVAVYNARVTEIMGVPEDLLSRHPSFEELLAYQWQQNEFNDTTPDVQSVIRDGGLLKKAQIYERRRPNGMTVEVRSIPLPGGGVVLTYTDISARAAAEEALNAARDEADAARDEADAARDRADAARDLADAARDGAKT